MGFVSKRIAKRIEAVGEVFNNGTPVVECDGIQLSDEEMDALACGVTAGLCAAYAIAAGEISQSMEPEAVASMAFVMAHGTYVIELAEKEADNAEG